MIKSKFNVLRRPYSHCRVYVVVSFIHVVRDKSRNGFYAVVLGGTVCLFGTFDVLADMFMTRCRWICSGQGAVDAGWNLSHH